jgi:hypothetical protein
MSQETNLNVSPYFDDFDADKNYYKVLFKPGYPVQARELNTLQSIAQYQTEQFGKHIFKEGSVVIPGQLRYENPLYSVQIEQEYNGIPISFYFNNLVGAKIRGQNSGVSAEIVYLLSAEDSEKGNYTLYVKYLQSGGDNFDKKVFENGETLVLNTPITYGNLTIQQGEGFCNTLSQNAIYEGSAVSVAKGVYFVRGIFADVEEQTILLDQYGTNPSYKIGFDVEESIVTSDEDSSLFDNAKGFSNYAAPGADRFRLKLILSKKNITEDSESFVEIMRVDRGIPQFLNQNPQYNIIRDELARRTYDESGDYFVKPFTVFVRDSFNDRVLSSGMFFESQKTPSGNIPSEDLMVYQIGPGKAYVKGYDVETISPTLIDVNKTRSTENVPKELVTYNAGTFAVLNNGFGAPTIGLGTDSVVYLQDSRKTEDSTVAAGTTIGVARVYDFVPESDYVDQTSRLNIRLFDIRTYTNIGLTTSFVDGLSIPAFIEGKNSKATGYLKESVTSSDTTLTLYETTGNFLENEQIIVNGIDDGRLINSVTDYSISDIKSLYATNAGVSTFSADLVLQTRSYIAKPGTTFKINNGVVSAGLDTKFTNIIKVGDIVSFANTSFTGDPIYNKVTSIGLGGTNFTIAGITTVSGVCNGALPSGSFEVTNIIKHSPSLNSRDSSFLTRLGADNVASISLEESEILQRRSFSVPSFSGSAISITIDSSDKDIYFESFDEDRYLISYEDGTIELMRQDKFLLDATGKTVTFRGLTKDSGSNAEVIATVKNLKVNSKKKKLNKISTITVSNSTLVSSGIGTTTLNDGLSYSNIYGTRVQDKIISLNVPDAIRVLGIFESTGTSDPKLPKIQISGSVGGNQDFIVGERIEGKTSGSVGIIVSKIDTDKIEYVYLNTIQFIEGEVVVGKQSTQEALITNKILCDKNITQNYLLDDGQRDTFYDFSRIIRKNGVSAPNRKIKVVFQNYTIDPSDTGEIISANSYSSENFKYDVPIYQGSRLTDFIDIRPRVAPYTPSNKSPFEFDSRNFASDGQYSEYILAPDENILLSYDFYVGRIDRIYLSSDGKFEVVQGIPSINPVPGEILDNALDICTIYIPPYVFNTKNVEVDMSVHKRYRMEDISLLEERIRRVEKYTTLSMLESKTENFIIKDSETGLDRFKCGFFVDNFSSHEYHDLQNPNFKVGIDKSQNICRPRDYTTSIDLQLGSEIIEGFTDEYFPNRDQSYVSNLGSPNVRKTGDLITLNYNNILYFEQPYASKTESVTPFLVRYWTGSLTLNPPIDTWVDEIATQTTTSNEIVNRISRQDENVTVVNNTVIDGDVLVSNPNPQTGLGGFDWIGNAISLVTVQNRNTQLSSIAALITRFSSTNSSFGTVILGGSPIKIDPNINSRNISSSGRGEDLNVIGSDVIQLNVFKSRVSEADRNLIRQLLPADVAEDFITVINTKNNNRRAVINFIPGNGATIQESTTTESVSDVSTIIIPEEVSTSETISESISNYTEEIRFLRSRNIEFDAKALRPRTRFYPFFEGVDVSNYVIPKLLEIEMVSGKFVVGETVESDSINAAEKIVFRVCKPNHRSGPYDGFDIPTILPPRPVVDATTGEIIPVLEPQVSIPDVFKLNPYTLQPLEDSYSESSSVLNVDTRSLELPSEGEYYGLVAKNMRLVGKESGAVAIVRDIRLVSDNQGRLIGSLFIPNPNIPSNPKWINGENTFTLIDTNSLDNLNEFFDEFIANSRINESSAQADFTSSGITNVVNTNILTTRNITILESFNRTTTTITNTTTNTTTSTPTQAVQIWENHDPLAQSFYVRDNTGIFLTAVEVFFETKDEEIPVTLQIRPMIAGVPSNEVVPFSEVTLSPDEVNLSSDGSVPTRFVFPSPVYLPGPKQLEVRSAPIGSQQSSTFAVVLLSGSPQYRVYILELGQNDIQTGIKISAQPTLGSLFKSQNGETWSPAQLEDLKYRLYRADFTTDSGLVRFFNPKLSLGNKKVTVTGSNQFLPLSKKIIVGLGSDGYDSSGLIAGASLKQGSATGDLIGIGGSITSAFVINPGTGYTNGTFTGVELRTNSGSGTGAIATIDISDSGIGTVTITSGGINYQIGDTLSIPESEFGLNVGFGGKIGVSSISSIANSLIIDNVQGTFSSGITTINYINSSGVEVSTGATISSVDNDSYNDGLHMKIIQLNHGMHSPENYVEIKKVRPQFEETSSKLSSPINKSDLSIILDSTSGFETFEGQTVSGSNLGYLLIGEEVVEYNNVTGNTITLTDRGIDNTQTDSYVSGTSVRKYQLNGISLRRINKVHNLAEVDISKYPMDLNSYFIKIDTSDTDFEGNSIGKNRENNLYFNETIVLGLPGAIISNNIQFEVCTAAISNIIPAKTNIKSKIRTFTGTSIGGNEKSFLDYGFKDITLNTPYEFTQPMLVCSDINEQKFITDSPGNRSLSLECNFTTTDSRVSPVIDTVRTSMILTSNLINNPSGINKNSNYANDDTVRSLDDDKHAAVYISKPVRLKIPANSIKVLLSASHTSNNDIRVLYQLFRDDSPESSLNYELFPGFSNYQIDGDGIKRVIDRSLNDGSADSDVVFDTNPFFKDYEYSVDDLPEFNAFAIKIVMASKNQANPPMIKDLRAIATIKPKV